MAEAKPDKATQLRSSVCGTHTITMVHFLSAWNSFDTAAPGKGSGALSQHALSGIGRTSLEMFAVRTLPLVSLKQTQETSVFLLQDTDLLAELKQGGLHFSLMPSAPLS